MELGQLVFGNPTGEYQVSDLGEAVIKEVCYRIGLAYWNEKQEELSETYMMPEGSLGKISWRPYYWGEDDDKAALPNLSAFGLEIRWYKYVGRGMTTNADLDPGQWADWLKLVLQELERFG